MQKSLPSLLFKQLFTSKQTPFNISLLKFVRPPISLLLNHSHGFEPFWLVESLAMIVPILLDFDTSLAQVMPPILHLRKPFLFHRYAAFDIKITVLEALKPLTTRFFINIFTSP